jgi:hypothetical protein
LETLPHENSSINQSERLLAIGLRSRALGDENSAKQVEILLVQRSVADAEQIKKPIGVALLLGLLLFLYWIVTVRRKPRPEFIQ